MTPIQAARKHCDCLIEGDTCLGVTTNDEFKLVRFRKQNSPCLLLGPKCQRCQHFESAILPMESRSVWSNDSRASKLIAKEFREAVHLYRMQSGALSQADRICPRCDQRELQPRQRFCYVCAKELDLISKRTSAAKSRNSDQTQNVES